MPSATRLCQQKIPAGNGISRQPSASLRLQPRTLACAADCQEGFHGIPGSRDWLVTYDGEHLVEAGYNPGWGGLFNGTYYLLRIRVARGADAFEKRIRCRVESVGL